MSDLAENQQPIIIVGAGPIGMVAALELARFGVPSIILDDDNKFADGSRAIAMHNSILEVFERHGCLEPMLAKATIWTLRRTFFRDRQISLQEMPALKPHDLPTFVNLQQHYTEEYIYRQIAAHPLIDLYWEHRVTDLTQNADSVTLTVQTPTGERQYHAPYVIACDGARSTCRKLLNLDFPGHSHPDSFLIADIRAELAFERQPRFFFDHPTNPGSTILVHPQPDGIWRIDWQVGAHIDIEQEKQPEQINQRIRSLIGDTPFEIVWLSDYRFHQRLLEHFQHGRVFFAGDSAHLVAPFGARGMNSGVLDAENLAWKLALVVKGFASPELLHSYDSERWPAQKENQIVTDRTMRFMVPPTLWHRLKRGIILRLSPHLQAAQRWVDSGKMAVPFTYTKSQLNIPDSTPPNSWQQGPVPGSQAPDVALIRRIGQETKSKPLRQFLPASFLLAAYQPSNSELETLQKTAEQLNATLPVSLLVVLEPGRAFTQPDQQKLTYAQDTGEFASAYQASPGNCYLIRPDRHLAARLNQTTPEALQTLLSEVARRYALTKQPG